MHMFSREKNFYGGHGIVGAQVAIGTGLAFANKYRGTDEVGVAYFGEGAAQQGQVYESFNLAALHKLPCIYVIENNRYGMGTSVERSSAAAHNLSEIGAPWKIPGRKVDGMDLFAVHEAAQEAVAHCRAGKGPFLLEMEPIVIAVTRCPILHATATAQKSKRCAARETRSKRCTSCCPKRAPVTRRSRRSMSR